MDLLHGKRPAIDSLMRQPSYKVDVDVCDPSGTQAGNIIENRLPIMQTPHRGRFLIDKRLHAQAHTIHAALLEPFENNRIQRPRRAFDRNLRTRLNLEILRNRHKKLLQLRDIQYSRSSAAHVDGVDNPVGAPAHLCYSRVVTLHVSAHPVHIVLKHGAGEDIGSEVAIAALRTTKGHGNVQAKSHPTIIALLAERPGRRLLETYR